MRIENLNYEIKKNERGFEFEGKKYVVNKRGVRKKFSSLLNEKLKEYVFDFVDEENGDVFCGRRFKDVFKELNDKFLDKFYKEVFKYNDRYWSCLGYVSNSSRIGSYNVNSYYDRFEGWVNKCEDFKVVRKNKKLWIMKK